MRDHRECEELIVLCLLCGEISKEGVHEIVSDHGRRSLRRRQQIIKGLKDKEILIYKNIDGEKGFRLEIKNLTREKPLSDFYTSIKSDNQLLLEPKSMLRNTAQSRAAKKIRSRLLMRSRIILSMYRSGAIPDRNEKPTFGRSGEGVINEQMIFNEAAAEYVRSRMVFYADAEIKKRYYEASGEWETDSTLRRSKAIGALIGKGEGYVVYMCRYPVMKYNRMSEYPMKQMVGRYVEKPLHMLLYGNEEMLKKILENGKRQKGTLTLDESGYSNVHYVPLNPEEGGAYQIRLLANPNVIRQLERSIIESEGLLPGEAYSLGKTGAGKSVFAIYDFELNKINYLLATGNGSIVYCMVWQGMIVKRLAESRGVRLEYRTLKEEEILNLME